MTRQERINSEFQRQIDMQNSRIDKIDAKLDGVIKSLEDFKAEMRDRDNQRASENQALRAEMSEIRSNLQNLQLSGRNTNIMMFLGIAAMVIAVLLK